MKKLNTTASKFQLNAKQLRDLTPDEAAAATGGSGCGGNRTSYIGGGGGSYNPGILPNDWAVFYAPAVSAPAVQLNSYATIG